MCIHFELVSSVQQAKQATPTSSAKKGRPTPQQQAPQRLPRDTSEDTTPASQSTPAAPRARAAQPGAKAALASAFESPAGGRSPSGVGLHPVPLSEQNIESLLVCFSSDILHTGWQCPLPHLFPNSVTQGKGQRAAAFMQELALFRRLALSLTGR